jgi:integrase
MMTLACCLGLRPSEFLGLQWPDLDVDRGMLAVSRSITWLHVEATKTPDSEDEIALDPDVLAVVLRWKEQCLGLPNSCCICKGILQERCYGFSEGAWPGHNGCGQRLASHQTMSGDAHNLQRPS